MRMIPMGFNQKPNNYRRLSAEVVEQILVDFKDTSLDIYQVAQKVGGVSACSVHKYWQQKYGADACEKRKQEVARLRREEKQRLQELMNTESANPHATETGTIINRNGARNCTPAETIEKILGEFYTKKSSIQVGKEFEVSHATVIKWWRRKYGDKAVDERNTVIRKLQNQQMRLSKVQST